jgi:hypothetical protein
MTEKDLEEIHRRMLKELKKHVEDPVRGSARIDDIFYCPHDISDNCNCRKPKPGLLIQAQEKWEVEKMALKFVRIEPKTEEEYQQFLADEKDSLWFSEHYEEIKEIYKGKYVAVLNEQLFVGDTIAEAEAKAKAKYPNREPFVDYIPYKRRIMVL